MMSTPQLIKDLPKVNRTITGHYRDDGTLCPWSRCRVTRLITACPNGCEGAVIVSDQPDIALIDVVNAVADSLDEQKLVAYLGLQDGDWTDATNITGHSGATNILILHLRDSGREFTITINETV